MSYDLATIYKEVPIDTSLDSIKKEKELYRRHQGRQVQSGQPAALYPSLDRPGRKKLKRAEYNRFDLRHSTEDL